MVLVIGALFLVVVHMSRNVLELHWFGRTQVEATQKLLAAVASGGKSRGQEATANSLLCALVNPEALLKGGQVGAACTAPFGVCSTATTAETGSVT